VCWFRNVSWDFIPETLFPDCIPKLINLTRFQNNHPVFPSQGHRVGYSGVVLLILNPSPGIKSQNNFF